jgi:acetoin utilization protein AcuB
VTKGDILRGVPTEPVRTVMTRAVLTVTPATPLEDAAKLMLERKVGALPVLDAHAKPIGILTESDTLRALIASISVGGPGVRLTLRGPEPDAVIRFIVDAAVRHHMQLLAILVTGSGNDRRILAKLAGNHGEAVIGEVWKSGYTVMSAQRF